MRLFKEFREFAVKGNVVDLAVGIIIGAAFGAIVRSLVDDVIMPVAGALIGGVDFSDKYVVLRGHENWNATQTVQEAKAAGVVTLNYGLFLNNVLTFFIVAFAVFLLVKQINRLRRERNTKPSDPTEKKCPYCYSSVPLQATRCSGCTARLSKPTPTRKARAE